MLGQWKFNKPRNVNNNNHNTNNHNNNPNNYQFQSYPKVSKGSATNLVFSKNHNNNIQSFQQSNGVNSTRKNQLNFFDNGYKYENDKQDHYSNTYNQNLSTPSDDLNNKNKQKSSRSSVPLTMQNLLKNTINHDKNNNTASLNNNKELEQKKELDANDHNKKNDANRFFG